MNRATEPAPAHWVTRNEMTRLPRRWVTLDTEAVQVDQGGRHVQTFRCAVACVDSQDKRGRPWSAPRWGRFTDAAELWRWVDAECKPGRRTVVVCHNLGYDLRIADAFAHLPRLGWELALIRLDGGQAWAQWRDGRRSLAMVDSTSWFGCSIETLGDMLHIEKVALPAWDDPDDRWFDRCTIDVEILRTQWNKVLAWIESDDMGNWKPTAAGQGWAAFRHRFMDVRILHHPFHEIAATERTAAWAGRCEAWRWGDLGTGPWTEWDFTAAYCQVAYDCNVPVRFLRHLGPKGVEAALYGPDSLATLARVHVSTEAPCVPAAGDQGVLWPVGDFDTVLWDVEIDTARRAGATVTVHEGWLYEAGPALRTWASWVLDALALPADQLDPALRLVVKNWSRSLIGRFGSRWSTWSPYAEPLDAAPALAYAHDADTGRDFRVLTIGGVALAETEQVDAPDGAVHVMSWVMACARARMWAAMVAAGLENVAYVDTDGLIVGPDGDAALEMAQVPGLRRKTRWRHVEVFGPRQLVVDGKLRAAGVSRRAERTGPRSWRGEVWQGLGVAVATGRADRVEVTPRTWTLAGTDRRRAHLPGGQTAPLALSGEAVKSH